MNEAVEHPTPTSFPSSADGKLRSTRPPERYPGPMRTLGLLAALLATITGCQSAPTTPDRPPNVILVYADEARVQPGFSRPGDIIP